MPMIRHAAAALSLAALMAFATLPPPATAAEISITTISSSVPIGNRSAPPVRHTSIVAIGNTASKRLISLFNGLYPFLSVAPVTTGRLERTRQVIPEIVRVLKTCK